MAKKQGNMARVCEISKFLHMWKIKGLVDSKDFGNFRKN
jgi:hypothetical protein